MVIARFKRCVKRRSACAKARIFESDDFRMIGSSAFVMADADESAIEYNDGAHVRIRCRLTAPSTRDGYIHPERVLVRDEPLLHVRASRER